MIVLAKKLLSRARAEWHKSVERRRLGPLCSPDPTNLDLDAHLKAAVDWLKRAQDAGEDRGVSYGVRFGSDFDVSYPETTGYICRTFVQLSRQSGQSEFASATCRAADWLVRMQEADGNWVRGNSQFAGSATIYNVKAAWGLCEAGMALGRKDYVDAHCGTPNSA
jgi:hypothetical protein